MVKSIVYKHFLLEVNILNSRKYHDILNGKLNTVGKNIKLNREKQKKSRQYLSNQLMILGIDISSQSIFDIETGTRTVIDYELCAIAKILGVTTDSLLEDFNSYLNKI